MVLGVNNGLRWLPVSLLIVSLDQLSKWWVTRALEPEAPVAIVPHANLTLVHNHGTAMGLMQGADSMLLAALSILITVYLLWWLSKESSSLTPTAAGLALVVGGAVGNTIDRLHLGYVVDFIHLYWAQWSFYVFNVADLAITAGLAIMITAGARKQHEQASTNAETLD